MPDEKRIHELTSAPDFDDSTLVEVSCVDQSSAQGYSSYKGALGALFDKILRSVQFTQRLNTQNKTVFGAINELQAGGGGGASALDDLSDVTITSPQVGQVLSCYLDGQNKKWKNTYPLKELEYYTLEYDDVVGKYYIDVDVDALVVFGRTVGDFVCAIGTTDLGDVGNPSVYFFSGSYWDGNEYNGWHVTFSRIVEDNGVRKMQYMVGYGQYSMTYFDMYEMELFDTKEISGTLTAGATSITLSDAAITPSSTIEIFTEVYGVSPTAVSVSNGSVTMTFEAQASNMGVKVRVS